MIEMIGFIAAILTTGAFFPQMIYVVKTKNVKDISLAMYLILTSGMILWLTYGILIDQPPIVISNIFTISMVIVIIYHKIKYD